MLRNVPCITHCQVPTMVTVFDKWGWAGSMPLVSGSPKHVKKTSPFLGDAASGSVCQKG